MKLDSASSNSKELLGMNLKHSKSRPKMTKAVLHAMPIAYNVQHQHLLLNSLHKRQAKLTYIYSFPKETCNYTPAQERQATTICCTAPSQIPLAAAKMEMPLNCFGTMEPQGKDPGVIRDAVYQAIQAGYRHFDTAEMYGTTALVGQAIESAINDKLVTRRELFITTKLKGMPLGEFTKVEARMKQVLKSLKLKQVDLVLIHWPGPESVDMANMSPDDVGKTSSFEWFAEHIDEAWKHMGGLRQAGYTRFIGTSNFYEQHIELMRSRGAEVPFANQIYMDLCHQEQGFVKYLKALKIAIMAYRPLAFCAVYGMIEDVAKLLEENVQSIDGCESVQQLILSSFVSQGICVVSSTTSREHLRDNLKTVKVEPSAIQGYDGNELVDMYGGVDEYAMVFKSRQK